MSSDLNLPQFSDNYDAHKMRTMVDILQNKFSSISTVIRAALNAAYQLHSDITPVGTVGATEVDLISYNIQPNVLALNGYNIEVEAWGTFAANANNKQLRLYFGAALLYDTGIIAVNDGVWWIKSIITRTGAATEQAITSIICSNPSIVTSVSYVVPTETLSAIITLRCTGEAPTDGDIIQKGLLVKLFKI